MCKFISGAINQNGDVFIIQPEDSLKVGNPDSHDDIFKFFGLSDYHHESDSIINCKFEFTPPNNDHFASINDWILLVDEIRITLTGLLNKNKY